MTEPAKIEGVLESLWCATNAAATLVGTVERHRAAIDAGLRQVASELIAELERSVATLASLRLARDRSLSA